MFSKSGSPNMPAHRKSRLSFWKLFLRAGIVFCFSHASERPQRGRLEGELAVVL